MSKLSIIMFTRLERQYGSLQLQSIPSDQSVCVCPRAYYLHTYTTVSLLFTCECNQTNCISFHSISHLKMKGLKRGNESIANQWYWYLLWIKKHERTKKNTSNSFRAKQARKRTEEHCLEMWTIDRFCFFLSISGRLFSMVLPFSCDCFSLSRREMQMLP